VTENKDLEKRFQIHTYPTLIWFVDGKAVEYTGGRTKDTIIQWINKRSGQSSRELQCDEIAPTTSLEKLNLVFFGDFQGSLYKTFLDIAKVNEKYNFFHASGDCARENGGKHNSVSIFRSFDKSPLHFTGSDKSVDAIQSWMEKSALPTLIEFAAEFIEPVLKRQTPSIILFTDEAESTIRSVFKEASEALEGDIKFVVSGTKSGIQKRLAEFSLVTAEMTPTIRILQPGTQMRRFIYQDATEEITVSSLKSFIEDHKADKIRPHFKSEEVHPHLQGGAVTHVVGTNYNQIVNDPTKDVFVKYFAPWCKHC